MSNTVTRYAIIVMVLIGFTASVYACTKATSLSSGNTRLERLATGAMEGMDFAFRGTSAPNDTFIGSSGETLSLADFRGKVVLVNFWATWCPPCEEEMPSLGALHSARSAQGLHVLALSIDEVADRKFAGEQLRKLTGGTLEFYQARDLGISYSFGVSGFPTTILYDRDGLEVARYQGDTDWAGYEAIAFIDQILETK